MKVETMADLREILSLTLEIWVIGFLLSLPLAIAGLFTVMILDSSTSLPVLLWILFAMIFATVYVLTRWVEAREELKDSQSPSSE